MFVLLGLSGCFNLGPRRFVIADSTAYEASLFRQNCAICHGSEADGRTLDNGTVIPSLRIGEFRTKTDAEIYRQIAQGGNGMLPFRSQLTERELKLMVSFVRRDLRGQ